MRSGLCVQLRLWLVLLPGVELMDQIKRVENYATMCLAWSVAALFCLLGAPAWAVVLVGAIAWVCWTIKAIRLRLKKLDAGY